ncbi:O-methyltransferase [Streptomyces sp. NPDC018045]|uniref:O-methyltransferase n=1 Tax=Streptomyces sp. NPDC018045 TaxID=3365037 RepID=UPI0037956038
MPENTHRPLRDSGVNTVIDRLASTQQFPPNDPRARLERDPHDYSEYGFSVLPEQGDLVYLLCRGLRATRVVEFATSVGMSTLYFAAAVRDNGGGTVIGSEIVAAKVAAAKRNLAAAGLSDYVDIREGDARTTLRDLGGPVDFALIDGWLGSDPSLARQVIELIAPQLRVGGYVMNDNAEPDFLDYIRDPANGFLSVTLPLHGGTELGVKVDASPGSS